MATVEKCFYAYFEQYAAQCGSNPFLFDEGRRFSVDETFHEVIAIGNRLHDFGVRQGNLVALRCTRSLDGYLIYLALQFLGATAVLTSPHQPVDAFFRNAGVPILPDFVITNEAAGKGIAANGDWVVWGHGALEICTPGRKEAPRFAIGSDLKAPSTILFTSGSTGKSKAATLSQEALLQYGEDSVVYPWHHPDDIAIVTLPTHHGFALCLLTAALVARYALFFPRSIQPEYVLACIETHKITRINGVPSYLYTLARTNELQKRNLASLRTGFTAGAPIVPSQHRFVEQTLGIILHPLYGMSESISISCTCPTDSAEHRATTVGRFHRNAGCILDGKGNPVPQGQEGEICVRGSAIMNGYYGDPEATGQAIDAAGRLHTGDLGYLDQDGYLRITGRIKDIIIRNGINLSPAKIEAAIRSLPEVENAIVVGVRHEFLGEAPCALVVLKDGDTMTADTLNKRLTALLPKNEVPVSILFTPDIPLNPIGKPDKQAIRKLFPEWREL